MARATKKTTSGGEKTPATDIPADAGVKKTLARKAPAPKAAAPAATPKPTDDSGFQPIPFSFDDFGGEEEAAAAPSFEVIFKPRSDLYSKGNDAALLLRDLRRLGDMSIHCDMSALPPLPDMDPEAAYFSWKIHITTDKGEEGIRQVFEFACEQLASHPCKTRTRSGKAPSHLVPAQT